MTQPVGILDYGCGNLQSVANALTFCGLENQIVRQSTQLESIKKLILPGVGAFDFAMNLLRERELINPLKKWVDDDSNLLVGICLGMQLLCRSSEESEVDAVGLALIDAEVKLLKDELESQLPNIGWCPTTFTPTFSKFNADYYFVHSYGVFCDTPEACLATSYYGNTAYASAITNGKNIFGFQFHPEKSHKKGLFLLEQILAPND